jgi:hypothetical protein
MDEPGGERLARTPAPPPTARLSGGGGDRTVRLSSFLNVPDQFTIDA